jgi:serine/threonine-protein kinase
MSKLAAEKFIEYVERSGLIEKGDLAKTLSTWGESGVAVMDDAERLADKLVEAKVLTRWQCDNLLQGKYRAFFLGQYKLLGLLGTGGMSSVYLAEHTLMHCLRAIKVLPQSRVEDSSYLARFRQEAVAAASLNHPNIVQAFDISKEGKHHFIVMEYVEGRDFQTLVKDQGPLEYETAADYIRQGAEGLSFAHQSGLIHRDIKPANFLVDAKGTVKLLDLGLARFVDDKAPSLTIAHDENVLGTADYLSPEQAVDSHGVDHRADIYSLGCTLYFLLTGHPPFPQGTLPQRIYMHQTKAPASIYEDRPDAPQALVDLCLRTMAKAPDARFQTAKEVANALGAWLAARNQGSSGNLEVSGRPQPPRRRPASNTPLPRPPRRERPVAVDDTLSDMDRATIKGPSAARPQSGPTDSGQVNRAPDAKTGSDRLPGAQPGNAGSDPSLRKAKPLKGDSDRAGTRSGLQRAQSLGGADDDPTSALFGAAGLGSSAKLARDLMGHRLANKKKASAKPPPKWLWYMILGLFLVGSLLLFLLIRGH